MEEGGENDVKGKGQCAAGGGECGYALCNPESGCLSKSKEIEMAEKVKECVNPSYFGVEV